MSGWLKKLWTDEDGATMVEYAVMVALICAVCIAIVKTMGTQVQNAFQTASDAQPAS